MLEKLDQKALGLCTLVAHAFQRITGKTNYFIAKIGALMASISTILQIANYFSPFLEVETDLFWLVCCVLINLDLFFNVVKLDKAEKDHQISEECVLPEIAKKSSFSRRIQSLLFGFFYLPIATLAAIVNLKLRLVELAGFLFVVGLLIFYYFVAVEPLKPGKSKIRQWVKKFSALSVPKLAPAEK